MEGNQDLDRDDEVGQELTQFEQLLWFRHCGKYLHVVSNLILKTALQGVICRKRTQSPNTHGSSMEINTRVLSSLLLIVLFFCFK